MKTLVCLPTYNERENVEPVVRAVRTALPEAAILVVDDASPDGTGEAAAELAAELRGVDVLHRPQKEGLGPAYVDAFRYALAEGAELVVTMDCDFSHDPADAPRLVAAAAHADLVLGSRYVSGGSVGNWGAARRTVSVAGVAYARLVLGVGVRDLTSGFKCYRGTLLEQLPLDRIRSRGYAFQVETTYRAVRAGFRVRELPIAFVERGAGRSKMSRAIVLEAVWRIPALRAAALAGRL